MIDPAIPQLPSREARIQVISSSLWNIHGNLNRAKAQIMGLNTHTTDWTVMNSNFSQLQSALSDGLSQIENLILSVGQLTTATKTCPAGLIIEEPIRGQGPICKLCEQQLTCLAKPAQLTTP